MSGRDGRIPIEQVDPGTLPEGDYMLRVDYSGPVLVFRATPLSIPSTALVPVSTMVDGQPTVVYDDDGEIVLTEVPHS